MNQRNYQRELEQILQRIQRSGQRFEEPARQKDGPTLFLHSCCAPCSSYVLEYLKGYFKITVFYYNPNISFREEYLKRVEEQKRLISAYNKQKNGYLIQVVEGDYNPQLFFDASKGLEDCPEGGERCFLCYELRLKETAARASGRNYDFFGTTLTISPLKNAGKLNEIGQRLGEKYSVAWLPSDFKKKDGYKRSIELSSQYGLYRQDYCGCAYSKAEREKAKNLLPEQGNSVMI